MSSLAKINNKSVAKRPIREEVKMCTATVCKKSNGDFCTMSWTMKEPIVAHPSEVMTPKDFVSMLSWFIRHDREKAEDFAWAWYHGNTVAVKNMVVTAGVRH